MSARSSPPSLQCCLFPLQFLLRLVTPTCFSRENTKALCLDALIEIRVMSFRHRLDNLGLLDGLWPPAQLRNLTWYYQISFVGFINVVPRLYLDNWLCTHVFQFNLNVAFTVQWINNEGLYIDMLWLSIVCWKNSLFVQTMLVSDALTDYFHINWPPYLIVKPSILYVKLNSSLYVIFIKHCWTSSWCKLYLINFKLNGHISMMHSK
jgi:hypothetical protein